MKRLLLVLFFTLLLLPALYAQGLLTVRGKITSGANNDPLIGASVQVKGTTLGAQTDLNGEYSLSNVASNATLVITYIGYVSQEVAVNGRTSINVALQSASSELDQVVVIGYGTQQKRDVTGSIVSLKAEEFEDVPVPNPLNALQGKAAGVLITNNGSPGSAPSIRIRGVGSINGVSPIFVVDGIITNNIDFINPNDIASMEILKDASSLAIFGLQGANGVVIVTTKRARTGETNINVNSYAGVQRVDNKIEVANGPQFRQLYNEQLNNLGQSPFDFDFNGYTADTDWQDLILRENAFINNNSVSITSATERNSASLSLSYFNQEGLVKYDSYKRYTAHLRDEFTINKNIKVGADINLFRWDRTPATGSITGALWAAPVYTPTHSSGVYNSGPLFQRTQVGNPLAFMEINKGTNISNGYRLVASAFGEVKFLKNFTLRSTFYTDLGFNQSRSYSPLYVIGVPNPDPSLDQRAQRNEVTSVSQSKDTYTAWQQDHLLTYSRTFNEKHDVTLLLGATLQYSGSDFLNGSVQGITANIPNNPDFWYLGISNDRETQRNGGRAEESALAATFARINYSFAGRYLLNASLRRDGTSRFGPVNQYDLFPSIGAGWVISEESFMQNQSIVNFLKLKASWGQQGNQQVGNYVIYPRLNTGISAVFGDRIFPAAQPEYVPNPGIRWEKIEGFDAGVEIFTLNNKLNLEIDYYNRKTRDILTLVPRQATVGVGTSYVNAGTVLNRGFEFTGTWSEKKGDFGYSISANFTTIHNEVLAIGENNGFELFDGNSRTSVGNPIGSFYGLVHDGIFQNADEVANSLQAATAKPGDIRYKDVDNDGVFNQAKDRTFIGSPTPDFTYGASLNFNYKGFELGIDLQGVAGNYIYNSRIAQNFAILNYEARRLGRWTGPGTSNFEPILDNTRVQNFLPSDYFLEKGDYFRIRNLTVGYNLPSGFVQKLRMKNAKVYVNAQNLKTFTDATGYSPEVGGPTPLSFGVDNGTYPVPSIFTGGININF
ncbi:SusC/RagA family TonB-linked outer membrane protein [Rufibacter quisquiliarum]|uniref:SusC/RagA family TonB-linked outer membrane protein n=1 Tax=Rufibacter quisquiliarum TaxID=1549639 RepID=UPI0015F7F151|nr:TonB-dependent receptor [Rufibacter quisquiliarum]